jgi:hypothetical protein
MTKFYYTIHTIIMRNFEDYVHFVYLGNNVRYGFMTYRDPITGNTKGYVMGKDEKGQPIYRKWRFNYDSQRQIRVHKEETDINGQSAIEFLRNSPECLGGPNGHMVNGTQVLAYFKEVNEGKDAAIALESREISLRAQTHAIGLKGQELIDIGAVIGLFDKDEEKLRLRVLDYASNYPTKFLELVEDPSKKVKALVKKAINSQVFSKDGKQIKWETKMIGADEDDAVSNLLKDEKLRKAIELNLAKFGG